MNYDKQKSKINHLALRLSAPKFTERRASSTQENITSIDPKIIRIAYLLGRNAAILDAKEISK
jgi:hypothetical protein